VSKPSIFAMGVAALVAVAIVARACGRPTHGSKPVDVARIEPTAAASPKPMAARELVGGPAPAQPTAGVPAPAAAGKPPAPDDTFILTKLHELAASDPEQSLKWARAALERSPRGPSAPEFEWNVVKALFNMGRLEDAQDEARIMVRDYPESDLSGDVVRHVLNPQPNPY
jgi:hypothetical protein